VISVVKLLAVLAVLLVMGCSNPPNVQTEVRLGRTIDGDTFETVRGEIIRLAGIDTPEKGEVGYLAATIELRSKLLRSRIILERQGVGKYGRTIACVYVDGKSIDEHMIMSGHARRWDGVRCE